MNQEYIHPFFQVSLEQTKLPYNFYESSYDHIFSPEY